MYLSRIMENNEFNGIRGLLDAYRGTLNHGVYFFPGKRDGDKLVGIEESVESYTSEELKEQYGVTSGQWLKGTGNDEFMKMRLPEAVTVPAVSVI